jgi:hypothetical protein
MGAPQGGYGGEHATSSQDLTALLDGLIVHVLRKLETFDAEQRGDARVQIEEREQDLCGEGHAVRQYRDTVCSHTHAPHDAKEETYHDSKHDGHVGIECATEDGHHRHVAHELRGEGEDLAQTTTRLNHEQHKAW